MVATFRGGIAATPTPKTPRSASKQVLSANSLYYPTVHIFFFCE